MADGPSGLLRAFLATDVYTDKGRLRSDDLLVRERVGRELGSAAAAIRKLISIWRADRVPPSTREQPFPPAAVMEPIRRAERLVKSVDDVSAAVRGLPLLNSDKVWDHGARAAATRRSPPSPPKCLRLRRVAGVRRRPHRPQGR